MSSLVTDGLALGNREGLSAGGGGNISTVGSEGSTGVGEGCVTDGLHGLGLGLDVFVEVSLDVGFGTNGVRESLGFV